MLRLLLVLCLLLSPGIAGATEAGWALLREGGHVVLLRHALAPGSGEPGHFDIEKCNTQRNLSEAGRQQARKIGALFAARAAPVDEVVASRWCRTLDTARLAFGSGVVEPFAALDPIAADAPDRNERIKELVDQVAAWTSPGNLVMVTHGETIAALTGESSRDGEAFVVRPDGERLHVLGRIRF